MPKLFQTRPKWTEVKWNNEARVLLAKTEDVWTAKRWTKYGLPVSYDTGAKTWTVELSSASPRMRWFAVFRAAIARTWFAPHAKLRAGHFTQRPEKVARVESKPLIAPRQGNGLAVVFEALEGTGTRIAPIGAKPQNLAQPQGLPWREPEEWDCEPNPDDM